MHSNAYTKWLELGCPQNPTSEMLAELNAVMELQTLGPTRFVDITGGQAILNIDLPRSGLSLIILNK